jgi:hypothetical protein
MLARPGVVYALSLSHADMRAQRPEKGGSLISATVPRGRCPVDRKGSYFSIDRSLWGETLITAILKRTMNCLGKKTLKVSKEEGLDYTFPELNEVYIDFSTAMDTPLLSFILQCDADKLPQELLAKIRAKLHDWHARVPCTRDH